MIKISFNGICKFSLFVLLFFFIGCGGGTTGTDEGVTIRVRGYLRVVDGAPLADVEVANLGTGEFSNTDINGLFEFKTKIQTDQIQLLLTKEGLQIIIPPIDLDSTIGNDSTIELQVEVDVQTQNAKVISVSIDPIEVENDPNTDETNISKPGNKRQTIIQGILQDQKGHLVSNAKIQIKPFAKQTSTQPNGFFQISIPSGHSDVEIVVTYQNSQASIKLSKLPKIPVSVQVKILIISTLGIEENPGVLVEGGFEIVLQEIKVVEGL